jgi:alpha-amylase
MSKHRAICLYLHVHQPWRVKNYSVFQAGNDHMYFNDETPGVDTNNRFIIDKVAEKSYLPTNQKLLEMLEAHPEFRLSMSISGVFLEQLEQWRPDVLDTFKKLTDTGRVEIVAETYHHSLAFFYSRDEFERQVKLHMDTIDRIFGQKPQVFRNTELSYNNDLAYWADQYGFKGIITEGWDPVLDWRSPNFVYEPTHTDNIRLLLKNYKLSDDIAFRFSNRGWTEWPLTTEKYVHWLNAIPHDQPLINLFMDYETFGEHQWADTGIFDFLAALPAEFMKHGDDRTFMTLSEAIDSFEPTDKIDVPQTITWADTERDLTAWLGNSMQHDAIHQIYNLEQRVLATSHDDLINDWRKLQTSDHFYYMCTKWFSDGDVHAYFSPYDSPYEAFISFMNVLQDFRLRLEKAEEQISG